MENSPSALGLIVIRQGILAEEFRASEASRNGALILIKKKFESRKRKNEGENLLYVNDVLRDLFREERISCFFLLSLSFSIYLLTDIFIEIFTLLRVRRVQYHRTGKITFFAVHLDYI